MSIFGFLDQIILDINQFFQPLIVHVSEIIDRQGFPIVICYWWHICGCLKRKEIRNKKQSAERPDDWKSIFTVILWFFEKYVHFHSAQRTILWIKVTYFLWHGHFSRNPNIGNEIKIEISLTWNEEKRKNFSISFFFLSGASPSHLSHTVITVSQLFPFLPFQFYAAIFSWDLGWELGLVSCQLSPQINIVSTYL